MEEALGNDEELPPTYSCTSTALSQGARPIRGDNSLKSAGTVTGTGTGTGKGKGKGKGGPIQQF
ncbi:hypothetical protein MMC18_001330 [Xylographa bjoerkii]|nr:hypothetical protein [Xylographa bjoerkii]